MSITEGCLQLRCDILDHATHALHFYSLSLLKLFIFRRNLLLALGFLDLASFISLFKVLPELCDLLALFFLFLPVGRNFFTLSLSLLPIDTLVVLVFICIDDFAINSLLTCIQRCTATFSAVVRKT